ncbi:MAG: Gfo/Idh/MocA family oxidoreductase, partial [Betaproteobacteria bacterium]
MKKLRIGVAGLGRAFTLMLPALSRDPRVELVAAADPRREALQAFKRACGGQVFDSVEELCKSAAIDVVYIATPHQFHAGQACLAASHGKHLL